MKLPKRALSYSQISLWLSSKTQYRKRYYENEKMYQNVEMIFGKKVAEHLEKESIDDPILARIPRYTEPEFQLDVHIDGVPVRGFIDSYEPDTHQFIEYKTGHLSVDGKPPWSPSKVLKHLQLPMYSLMLEEEFGKVCDKTHLVWIETRFKTKTTEFDGHILSTQSRELELTGKFEIFERIIDAKEREETRKLIVKVAGEISEDYMLHLQ